MSDNLLKNAEKTVRNILIIVIVYILIIFALYFGLSTDNIDKWGQFGDFLGGVINSFLSIINLIVLIFITIKIVNIEENRNLDSLAKGVRPLPILEITIGIDELKINLCNIGLGPLLIKDLQITSRGMNYTNFKDILDKFPHSKRLKYLASKKQTIRRENCSELLQIKVEQDKTSNLYDQQIDSLNRIKEELSSYKIILKYTDIYENEMPIYEDSLEDIVMNCKQ